MVFEVKLKEDAVKDLKSLDKGLQSLVVKQLRKLATSPQLGDLLGNLHGYDLTGYRKIYVAKKSIRIIYSIVDEVALVEVISIGKRDNLKAYEVASKRITS